MKPYFIIIAGIILILGCSKSDNNVDCNSGFNLYSVTADEVQDLSNAATVYSQDPSPANCNSYKNALNSYVDALDGYEKCALEFGYTDDWNEAIRNSRESINQLQCQ